MIGMDEKKAGEPSGDKPAEQTDQENKKVDAAQELTTAQKAQVQALMAQEHIDRQEAERRIRRMLFRKAPLDLWDCCCEGIEFSKKSKL